MTDTELSKYINSLLHSYLANRVHHITGKYWEDYKNKNYNDVAYEECYNKIINRLWYDFLNIKDCIKLRKFYCETISKPPINAQYLHNIFELLSDKKYFRRIKDITFAELTRQFINK